MPEAFHPIASFGGRFMTPMRFEADVFECEVIGEVPAALNGALYRTGGDRAYPSLEGDVIINGDGMFSMFHFEDGHVSFRARYVRTERLLRERAYRRRLYGAYRNRFTDAPEAAGTNRDNTGNTYAFFHHGRLFALREDSHPHEIDPLTLETLPVFDFNGTLQSTSLTAHPKIDPVTGEWWSFGLFATGKLNTDMMLHVIDREGNLVRQEAFQSPYPGLSHDFAVTRDHVVFPIMPLTVDEARITAGGPFYAYDPALPAVWGIMPRNGSTADLRWFKVPGSFSGHIMNAFSEGDLVHVDATISPGNGFPFFPTVNGDWTDPADGAATITRLTFDLSKNSDDAVSLRPFPGADGEMPRLDERFAMSRYRYGYFAFRRAPTFGIGRLDWDSGAMQLHEMPDSVAQEPLFVPRAPDAPEGDGYVLSVVNRVRENRADLVILDGRDVSAPPIATVKLPFNLPFSFHGCFVPADQLPR